ncbi:hypothetical protein VC83_05985 [Pseudogymnoascus destructans]|uniref:Uncharacterized protein n=2 Tax=Pseudogymnoascus destructans TaxID=655981 RepID=L8G7Y6_PSED2|nr:uncharacterized protein VC83_05985 [Pseudogymnoascus destructans]ELR08989.1 hypothetical protein GMDG_00607 [Pseudogymnoascus destructans 20631-21]OAF56993.1 hypothetical protein VC83_05985 [Pseudogymnoascus destructans]
MASQPDDQPAKDERPRRKWTDFEATVLMNLIIRNVHRTGLEKDEFSKLSDSTAPRQKGRNSRRAKEVSNPDKFKYVDVATALNRALHKSDYTHDIPVEEVEKLLHFFLRDRKGAIAVIDRQPTARLTRSTHRIWIRGLKFLGTKAEWDNGRKAAEQVKRREDQERRLNVGNAGAIISGATGAGVADGWGDDTAAVPSGDGWGTAANENNEDASAAAGAWGDAMEVDTPAKAANDPKASDKSSRAEASSGEWGSGAADSPKAAVTNAADPWGAAVETTVESNSAAAAWGEPEAAETIVTAIAAAAANWSVNEDPFATPLPPSLSSSVNNATSNAWGVSGVSNATKVQAVVDSDPWNKTSAGRSDPVSDDAGNAWGTITGTSTNGLSSTTTEGLGKTADTAANPWGTSSESAIPSLRSAADTTADPWGTSAATSVIQPSAMDWSTEVSNVAPENSFATKTVEQAAPVRAPVDNSASMGFADAWGEPVAHAPNQSAITAADGWGEPLADTPYQPVVTTGGWGDSIEKSQGHKRTLQIATAAKLNSSEDAPTNIKDHGEAQWNKTLAPVPPGWGPTSTTVANSGTISTNMPLWASVAEEVSPPSCMDSSNGSRSPSRQGSNSDKPSNNSVQAVQVSGLGINPDRLAMLAAAETDDNEASDFETTADEGFSRGKKSFKSLAAFGSKDNAIPLKFNRLAGK